MHYGKPVAPILNVQCISLARFFQCTIYGENARTRANIENGPPFSSKARNKRTEIDCKMSGSPDPSVYFDIRKVYGIYS